MTDWEKHQGQLVQRKGRKQRMIEAEEPAPQPASVFADLEKQAERIAELEAHLELALAELETLRGMK